MRSYAASVTRQDLLCTRQISQTSLEVEAERTTKMPFSGDCHSFDSSALKVLNDVGAVYGLFKSPSDIQLINVKTF